MLLNFWRKIAATGNGHRFAFLLRKNDSSHQCLHWWQQPATGRLHLDGFDSSAGTTKGTPPTGCPFCGAGNRNRTGTRFTARDFKSLVSTYSTMPAWNADIVAHFFASVKG